MCVRESDSIHLPFSTPKIRTISILLDINGLLKGEHTGLIFKGLMSKLVRYLGYSFPDYPSNWDEIRKEVLDLDGYKCQNCGTVTKQLHIHHIVPLMQGGSNHTSNLVCLCSECHKVEHSSSYTSHSGVSLYCSECDSYFPQASGLLYCSKCEHFLITRLQSEGQQEGDTQLRKSAYHYFKYGVPSDLEEDYQEDEEDEVFR